MMPRRKGSHGRYQCNRCERWLPKSRYYPHASPASACGIMSCCTECDIERRMENKRRAKGRNAA